jgi:hypothetical protein
LAAIARGLSVHLEPVSTSKCSKQARWLRPYYLVFIAALAFTQQGLAQKLVDPNTVAPEFREAAEKRRAQQIKIMECRHKTEVEKILPRDRTENINHCLEADSPK